MARIKIGISYKECQHKNFKKTDKVLNFKFDNILQFTLILKLTQGSFFWTQILNVNRESEIENKQLR